MSPADAPTPPETAAQQSVAPSVLDDAQLELVDLPSGDALTPQESAKVLGASPARVIVLGGPFGCGKTTLIASIYERFRKGPFAGLSFAGSRTLLGFEQICHPGREDSGLLTPSTDRTPMSQSRRMFHLRLADAHEVQRDVLLVDISGEEYDSVRNSDDACDELQIIRRADHFALLVDGEKLAIPAERHHAKYETETILQALMQTGILTHRTWVDLVVSKDDRIQDSPADNDAELFVAQMQQEISNRFQGSFAAMRFSRIAARRPDGGRPPADGVEGLLPQWFEKAKIAPEHIAPRLPEGAALRECDRFLLTVKDVQ